MSLETEIGGTQTTRLMIRFSARDSLLRRHCVGEPLQDLGNLPLKHRLLFGGHQDFCCCLLASTLLLLSSHGKLLQEVQGVFCFDKCDTGGSHERLESSAAYENNVLAGSS